MKDLRNVSKHIADVSCVYLKCRCCIAFCNDGRKIVLETYILESPS